MPLDISWAGLSIRVSQLSRVNRSVASDAGHYGILTLLRDLKKVQCPHYLLYRGKLCDLNPNITILKKVESYSLTETGEWAPCEPKGPIRLLIVSSLFSLILLRCIKTMVCSDFYKILSWARRCLDTNAQAASAPSEVQFACALEVGHFPQGMHYRSWT